MIELDKVGFAYPQGDAILADISFVCEAGERIVLLGANGCGKSTLLKLINGLITPTRGEIHFHGQPLTPARLRQRDFVRRFRGEVAMVFQHPDAMLFNATVAEEIAYGPRLLGMPDIDERVRRWAKRMQLEKYLDTPPFQLSGGEKQRLCLACVLACQPKLLLLDEPTANLDPRATGWLVDFLLDQAGLTTLVTTQNLSLAAELGQRALVLGEDGHLIHDGPLSETLANTELLWQANLAHSHRHRHADGTEHRHVHVHQDWS
jgi:cobalt/nickel transport system ATP-binding protein